MNILMISVDTLRADRLGVYGYPKPTSPYLDRVANQGVSFTRAYASDIPTEVAHTGLFCGRYGTASGIVAHGHPYPRLPGNLTWLPEALRRAGWTTAAVDNLYQLKPWFARGFRYYVNTVGNRRWIDGEDVTAETVRWLRTTRGDPFFLFVHYWDPHSPYLPPEGYRERFYAPGRDPYDPSRGDMEAAYNHLAYPFFKRHHYDLMGPVTDPEYFNASYDAEVRYWDEQLEQIDRTLEELGLVEDTWLIVLADHGESFTEHSIYWDHCGLYEPTVRIPLIMRWPGRLRAGEVISDFVQQIDLLPTIYEAAGIQAREPVDGLSLWKLLEGRGPWPRDRVYLSECAWQATRAVRTDRYKFIRTLDPGVYVRPPRELYDLVDDPLETRNVVQDRPDVANGLEADLARWVQSQTDHDPMLPVIEEELPFVHRMEEILADVGIGWAEWRENPSRAWYDRLLKRRDA